MLMFCYKLMFLSLIESFAELAEATCLRVTVNTSMFVVKTVTYGLKKQLITLVNSLTAQVKLFTDRFHI